MPDCRPIGVFDSGIGGLTVLRSLQEHLPRESFVYFGDLAHMPYGEKSPQSINAYALGISDYLIRQHRCKALFVACNSASAVAYDGLCTAYGDDLPVVDVINPLVRDLSNSNMKTVGVIGTKATVYSGIYKRLITRQYPDLAVRSLATPLLAPMVEEGLIKGAVAEEVIKAYLSHPELRDIDGIILGCTHYPLLRPVISRYYGDNLPVFDATLSCWKALEAVLENSDILSDRKEWPDRFFVSEMSEAFRSVSAVFTGNDLNIELAPIWSD